MCFIIFITGHRLLGLCDELRDQKLPDLGVLLEDIDGRTVVKYVGKELGIKEKEKQAQIMAEKQRGKEEQKRKQEELKVEGSEEYRFVLHNNYSNL